MSRSRDHLAREFARFAVQQCPGISPLYERLAGATAEDAVLLDLAVQAAAGPVPNLFLGAVHYLLGREPWQPLAQFYASLTPAPAPGDPFPAFRTFCLANSDALLSLLRERRVQTNEVRRCALLLPAFGLASRQRDQPLALIEVGTSAGFNLLWDRYGYDYGADHRWGDPASTVQLECTVRGPLRPPLPLHVPPVTLRVGIDLAPVDACDPEAVAWLRALIWPEQADRRALLARAVRVAQAARLDLRAGDALALLPRVLGEVGAASVACVYHSFTLNQFPAHGRAAFTAILADYGSRHDLIHIGLEGSRADAPTLTLTTYHEGRPSTAILANCSAHGQWMQWTAEDGAGRPE